MIEKKLKTITVMLNDDIQAEYSLIFQNALYSIECRVQGNNRQDRNSYYIAENITDDEGEAELFLHKMVKGKVFPVHIKDMVKDYFIGQ